MVNKFTPGATVSTERKWKKDRKQRMKERKTEQNEEPYHSALMCSAFFFVYLWPFVIVVCIVIYIYCCATIGSSRRMVTWKE